MTKLMLSILICFVISNSLVKSSPLPKEIEGNLLIPFKDVRRGYIFWYNSKLFVKVDSSRVFYKNNPNQLLGWYNAIEDGSEYLTWWFSDDFMVKLRK